MMNPKTTTVQNSEKEQNNVLNSEQNTEINDDAKTNNTSEKI